MYCDNQAHQNTIDVLAPTDKWERASVPEWLHGVLASPDHRVAPVDLQVVVHILLFKNVIESFVLGIDFAT